MEESKEVKIVKFIVLALLIAVILWWFIKPAGKSGVSKPPPCEPDYMGGCN